MCRVITCLAFLSLAKVAVQDSLSELPDGVTLHKGVVMWDEAQDQCKREGAVLASPINAKALNAMKSVMDNTDVMYYIGMKATDLPGQFVSIDGVSLENMPLVVSLNMVQQLDQRDGDCLAMNRDSIRAVPCWSKLPFMCYDSNIFNTNNTYCGPDVEGYKYDKSTGYCYKLHKFLRPWEEAHWQCISEGGNLAIVKTEQEARSVKNMDDFTHDAHIFIGRRKMTDKSSWMTIYGQPVEEMYNVVVGHRSSTDDEFHCGGLHRSGKLNYVRCWIKSRFVCQKNPIM